MDLCCLAAFDNQRTAVKPSLGLLILWMAAGNGFGAANEVVEFIAPIALPGTNVGGYANTGWDLVANFVGTMLAAAAIYAWGQRRITPRRN